MNSWENANRKVISHNVKHKPEDLTALLTNKVNTQTLIQVICLMGFHCFSSGSPVIYF